MAVRQSRRSGETWWAPSALSRGSNVFSVAERTRAHSCALALASRIPARSEEDLLFLSTTNQSSLKALPCLCHPDRSVAKWRDLQFHHTSNVRGPKHYAPFVIPSEADGYPVAANPMSGQQSCKGAANQPQISKRDLGCPGGRAEVGATVPEAARRFLNES
jgi:hypothetical protein